MTGMGIGYRFWDEIFWDEWGWGFAICFLDEGDGGDGFGMRGKGGQLTILLFILSSHCRLLQHKQQPQQRAFSTVDAHNR